jgi:hypothetical protein
MTRRIGMMIGLISRRLRLSERSGQSVLVILGSYFCFAGWDSWLIVVALGDGISFL